MRIISSFVDFYDCIQRVAQDRTLVYIRNPQIEQYVSREYFGKTKSELDYRIIVIYFCGKRYICIKITYNEKISYCYNINAVDKFVDELCSEKDREKYYLSKHKQYYFYRNCNRNHLIEIFKKAEERRMEPGDCSFQTPIIFTYTENDVTYTVKNGCLKKFEFYRLFDPHSAFQELSTYLGGLAVPLKEAKEPTNEEKIALAGFDKFSFRRDKSK